MKNIFLTLLIIFIGHLTIAENINKDKHNTHLSSIRLAEKKSAEFFSSRILKNKKTFNSFNQNSAPLGLTELMYINEFDTVYFDLSQSNISNGYIDIPVYIIAYDTINSLDFAFKYNHANLEYVTIKNLTSYLQGVLYSYNNTDSNIRFTSYSFKNYNSYVSLVLIRFRMLSDKVLHSDLNSMVAYLNGERVVVKIVGNAVMGITFDTINPSCTGKQDGNLKVKIFGGTEPFKYKWSNADTTNEIHSLSAGKYTVTVTDHEGYIKIASQVLVDPSLSFQVKNPSCARYSDGEIKLTVTGGSEPFKYNWSTTDTTKDIQYLKTDIYTVTVIDKLGCVLIASQSVTDSSGMKISYDVNRPSCPGFHDGSIEVFIIGGLEPYMYSWGKQSSSKKIDSLASGTYNVRITDKKGCKLLEKIVLNEPPEIMLLFNKTDLTCQQVQDGQIRLFVSGGDPPYKYLWNTYETTKDIQNLKTGTYTVTVSDLKGCSIKDSVIINNNLDIQFQFDKTDVSCFDSNEGSIQLNTQGGKPPFKFIWSNGKTSEYIENLSAGTYTVTVSQSNTCFKIDSVRIHHTAPISISLITKDPNCSLNSNGSIRASIQGGTEPYSFKWSNMEATDIISNLNTGTYILTVTDANNCMAMDTAVLKSTDQSCLEIFSAFTPNGDGKNDVWNIRDIYMYPNCTVNVYDQWGICVFNSKGYQTPWDGKYKGNLLPSATYYYIINLGNGVDYTGSVSILK